MSNTDTTGEPRRFRKKPVEIEAVQWDGSYDSAAAIISWAEGDRGSGAILYWAPGAWDNGETDASYLSIDTLEGRMLAGRDDWIICGIQSEFYPCKPEVFAATYEAVDGAS